MLAFRYRFASPPTASSLRSPSPSGMHVTLRQAAAYLEVPESTVRRWIASRGLPAHTINERLHCNAIELWQWAVEQGFPVSRHLLDQARREADEAPPLAALLAAGGIHHDVPGGSKADV